MHFWAFSSIVPHIWQFGSVFLVKNSVPGIKTCVQEERTKHYEQTHTRQQQQTTAVKTRHIDINMADKRTSILLFTIIFFVACCSARPRGRDDQPGASEEPGNELRVSRTSRRTGNQDGVSRTSRKTGNELLGGSPRRFGNEFVGSHVRVARSVGWPVKCVLKKMKKLKKKCKLLQFQGRWVNLCYMKYKRKHCISLDWKRKKLKVDL